MSQGVSGVGVGIILLRDNKVLLGKRTEDRSKGTSELKGEGTWTLPGGKMHFQETIEDVVKREVKEETNIDVNSFEVISVSNDKIPEKHFVTLGVVSEDFEGDPEIMEPEEITEWQWFFLDQLPSPMFPPSEKGIKNYLEKKFCRD